MILKYWNPQSKSWTFLDEIVRLVKREASVMCGSDKTGPLSVTQTEEAALDYDGSPVSLPTDDFVFHGGTFDRLRDEPGKQCRVKYLRVVYEGRSIGIAFELDVEIYLLSNDGKTIERL